VESGCEPELELDWAARKGASNAVARRKAAEVLKGKGTGYWTLTEKFRLLS
jgi:hypothetical protein